MTFSHSLWSIIKFKFIFSNQILALVSLILGLDLFLSATFSPFSLILFPTKSFPSSYGKIIQGATSNQPDVAISAKVTESFSKLPLSFEINQGQFDSQVKFLSKGNGYSFFLTPNEVVLSLNKAKSVREESNKLDDKLTVPTKPDKTQLHSIFKVATETAALPEVVRMNLVGGNANPQVMGEDEQPGKTNYFYGHDPSKWQTNVSHFSRVRYKDVYPGIDMVYYGNNQGQLEYDFVLAPGADPSIIKLNFEGVNRLATNWQGDLSLELSASPGSLVQHAPVIYQETNGIRKNVAGQYHLSNSLPNQVSFTLSNFDKTLPLTIDPTLVYSTYLGGSNDDLGGNITVDGNGNAYITGSTTNTDFPILNASQPIYGGGNYDAFVTKFSATGTLLFSTYLGGSDYDFGDGIAVDGSNNIYITGATNSTDFPILNASQPIYGGGNYDAFVTKFSATGTLLFSTYLGGSDYDFGDGIAVDGSNNIYVTGEINSTDFPTLNAFQSIYGGGDYDAFVTKFSTTGTLLFSTYLGGAGEDDGYSIAVDGGGNAYVTGYAQSPNFPTQNAFQPIGTNDAFVTKFSATGTLLFSTYLGGSDYDFGDGIAVDGSNNIYVTGFTASTDFPTQNASQPIFGGNSDAFVTKFSSTGTLLFSTFLGGSGYEGGTHDDYGTYVAVDEMDNIFIVGTTNSTDFPTQSPSQPDNDGVFDVFVTKFQFGILVNASTEAALRNAINQANPGDEIRFDPGVTQITLTADLMIPANVSLVGNDCTSGSQVQLVDTNGSHSITMSGGNNLTAMNLTGFTLKNTGKANRLTCTIVHAY